ncbi:V-type proton ATPase subunit D [Eumeta japonica]|uniref:V-type proton ATPase subunit D n=1 Tax=Eumeta variegata TaxID=151549 RepID=A0A4C1TMA8_EUMVA|nr:V-type proton ATPase subunit D [Eumeta japonica]
MDDDDEDALNAGMSSSVYACTPSLMALQQMKNRLHMAYLGKRLMKWTVLATSRDLRRIAFNISVAHEILVEDLREALVKLARCRYYHSQLNAMTVENHPPLARLTVSQAMKSVTGCKYKSFEVEDFTRDPEDCINKPSYPFQCGENVYVHLGIDKGGQVIAETKMVWVRLIRKIIQHLSLRISFTYLDAYTKVATKKMNVLSKIVIPKTMNTIKYIILELEERAREDFFRLKKVVDLKRKIRAKKEIELKRKCPICFAIMSGKAVEEKCDCLKTGKGPCDIENGPCDIEDSENIPVCIEKPNQEESAGFEVVVNEDEDEEKKAEYSESETVMGEFGENETDSTSLIAISEEDGDLERERCEGSCIGKKESKSEKKPKMPIYDHKIHFNIDEDETVCEGPCTTSTRTKVEPKNKISRSCEDLNKQFNIAGPNKTKIDDKKDFNQKGTADSINLPPCMCLESEKVEPSTPCGTPESNSGGSDGTAGLSRGEVRRTPVDTSVKKYTKIRRYQNCDGTFREEKITITIQTDSYEASIEDDLVRGNVSETDDDDDYTVGFCVSTDQSTGLVNAQILNQTRSEPVKKAVLS